VRSPMRQTPQMPQTDQRAGLSKRCSSQRDHLGLLVQAAWIGGLLFGLGADAHATPQLLGTPQPVVPAPVLCKSVDPSTVSGPCLNPDVFALSRAPADRNRWLLTLNFGSLWPGVDGQPQLICEEAYGGFTTTPLHLNANGRAYAAARTGLLYTDLNDGCTWQASNGFPPGAFVRQVVSHPARPGWMLALVVVGQSRRVYESKDGGLNFTSLFGFASGQNFRRIVLAPSDPSIVYVSGSTAAAAFALARSSNGGAAFDTVALAPALLDVSRSTTLRAVAPDDPNTLFLVRSRPQGGEDLWRATQSGQSATSLLSLRGAEILTALTFGPTSQTLFVGGNELFEVAGQPRGHLYISKDAGLTWPDPVPSGEEGPRFRCLDHFEGRLFACGASRSLGDRFLLGVSDDEGRSWQPLITLDNLPPVKTCVAAQCVDTADWLCTSYGICGEIPDAGPDAYALAPFGDAGVAADAGAPNDANGSGCACGLGTRRSTADDASSAFVSVPLPVLLALAWLAIRLHRRSPSNRLNP